MMNIVVGFGVNPFSSYNFAGMPRTAAEAINSGWKLDSTVGCKSAKLKFVAFYLS